MTVEEDNDGFLRIKYIQGLEWLKSDSKHMLPMTVKVVENTHGRFISRVQTLVSPLKMETICDVLCAAMRLIHGVWILG